MPTLSSRGLKERRHVLLGDDERMPRGNREGVSDKEGGIVLSDDTFARELAEDTLDVSHEMTRRNDAR